MAKKNNTTKKKGNQHKKKLISNIPNKKEEKILGDGIVEYEDGITVGELAEKIGQTPANVIKVLFMLGTMVTINSSLDDEQVELICLEYGYESKKKLLSVKSILKKSKLLMMKLIWLVVHLLLLSWDMLTMGKQRYWILFVNQKLLMENLVELLNILELTKLKLMERKSLS